MSHLSLFGQCLGLVCLRSRWRGVGSDLSVETENVEYRSLWQARTDMPRTHTHTHARARARARDAFAHVRFALPRTRMCSHRYENNRSQRSYVMYGATVDDSGGDEDTSALTGSAAVVARSSSSSSVAPVESATTAPAKYGFYLHVHRTAAAVIYQVRQIKTVLSGSPLCINIR
jgi:hypothetical protein